MNPQDQNQELEKLLKEWDARPPEAKSFTDQVMRRVQDLPTPRPWWRTLFDLRYFSFQLRPIIAVAVIFMLGAGAMYWIMRPPAAPINIVVTAPPPSAPQADVEKEHTVKFVYRDTEAKSVHIVGDFNNWQMVPMHHHEGGLWTITVPIAEGQYNYQFVIDGKKFVTDPNASEKSDDGYGQKDSILSL